MERWNYIELQRAGAREICKTVSLKFWGQKPGSKWMGADSVKPDAGAEQRGQGSHRG